MFKKSIKYKELYDVKFKQRNGFLFILYIVWVLSLPFHHYSVFESYSVDNLLAPFLCLMAIFLPRLRDTHIATKRFKVLLLVIFLYTFYGLMGLVKFINAPQLLSSTGWLILRDGFYFLTPLLYIRDLRSFRIMKQLIIWITMAGALSVFLVALGVFELPVERFETSRLGDDRLPKSVGFFSNYGDMTILYGYVSALLISHGRNELGIVGSRLIKLIIWIVLFLGLLGAQSRNMLLGTLIAMGVYWIWVKLLYVQGERRTALMAIFMAGIIIVPSILAMFSDEIIDMVSSLGGVKAEKTVTDRLSSYSQAMLLLANEPFGVSYETYIKWSSLINLIHNMWLKLLLNFSIIGMAAIAGLFWIAYKGGSKPAQIPVFGVEPPQVVASIVTVFFAVQFYPGLTEIMWVMLATLISFNWVRRQRTAGSKK